ncbi:hypothetical protein F511_26883 [Dorcoceras hygrometricum]|uniref:Uncharacterized protein n=1 Tax=Dorcoceras hygrometricum TaxID=472368 RepID=A0A2Z7B1L0_9LAMI|nr:hypothetical protein F511_26883 [Dorcoceras hygrometricum]
MAFASGLANTSLKYHSAGFYQMAKTAVTPSIVTAEFILYRKTVVAQIVVSFGVAHYSYRPRIHLFGACIAIAWRIPTSINKLLWSTLQQQENWTALALMWHTTPVTVFFLLALMPCLDPYGVLAFKWDAHKITAILISALLGFLLQCSGALALGIISEEVGMDSRALDIVGSAELGDEILTETVGGGNVTDYCYDEYFDRNIVTTEVVEVSVSEHANNDVS